MKKAALIGLCVFLLFSTVRSIKTKIAVSTLEIKVTLVKGGPDVSTQYFRHVGFVPKGKQGPATLGNITLIKPVEGTKNLYEVPANTPIAIFVSSPGESAFQSTVRVKPRQNLKHEFVLNSN